VIVVEFVGAEEAFQTLSEPIRGELARRLGLRPESILVRRLVTQGGTETTELWVELSSEEQVFRRGREIAEAITELVQQRIETDLWVMFRVVPLSHAFLNGRPRARGRANTESSPE